jgi:hypothetical protein
MRGILKMLQAAAARADNLASEQWGPCIVEAVRIRDSAESETRDKLRACELLATFANKGFDIAMYLDKNERLDAGEVTERVDNRILVIPPPTLKAPNANNPAIAGDDRVPASGDLSPGATLDSGRIDQGG